MPITFMNSQKPRVAVGVVGLLLALIGFFVSVVATLFAGLVAGPGPGTKVTSPHVFLPSSKRQERAAHSFGKVRESSSFSSSTPSASKTGKYNKSHPDFETTPASRTGSCQRLEHDRSIKSSLKPTIITFPPVELPRISSGPQINRPPRISTSEAYLSMSDDSRHGFRLSNLKPPWGDKRPKIYRCVSSPHLTTVFPPLCEAKVSSLAKKKPQDMHKAPGVPNRPGSPPDKGSTYRFVVKKHSQPLRTQPYEAPFFCPTPVPAQDIRRRDRPTRTCTLPHARQSPFSTPPLPPTTHTR